jgi:hypothetical protein
VPAKADACEHIMVWSGFVGMSLPGRVFPAIMEDGRDQA